MNAIDLEAPGMLKLVAKRIKDDIDAVCLKYDDGPRSHLGASVIGEECSRKIAYMFRWMGSEKFDARMLRLFNRGHKEEARFIEWLRKAKFTVDEFEPEHLFWYKDTDDYFYSNSQDHENPLIIDVEGDDEHEQRAMFLGVKKIKKQFRISGANGHFGGSLDGIAVPPEAYGIYEQVLTEYKTHGTGTKWTELKTHGVAYSKPKYYKQMCTYGAKMNLRYGIYIGINKNDDDIYVEVIKLDLVLGKAMETKAEGIIFAESLPNKISQNKTDFKCKYCAMSGMCHSDEQATINCRSCKHSSPVENAEWFCNQFQATIPKEFIAKGCGNWKQFE